MMVVPYRPKETKQRTEEEGSGGVLEHMVRITFLSHLYKREVESLPGSSQVEELKRKKDMMEKGDAKEKRRRTIVEQSKIVSSISSRTLKTGT